MSKIIKHATFGYSIFFGFVYGYHLTIYYYDSSKSRDIIWFKTKNEASQFLENMDYYD